MTEVSILKQVLSAFGRHFSHRENVRGSDGIMYDAIIYYKTIPYILVEVKHSLEEFHTVYYNLIEERKAENCYWCIIIDGLSCIMNGGESKDFERYSFADAIRKIKDVPSLAKNSMSNALREIELIFTEYGYDSFKTKIEIVPIQIETIGAKTI